MHRQDRIELVEVFKSNSKEKILRGRSKNFLGKLSRKERKFPNRTISGISRSAFFEYPNLVYSELGSRISFAWLKQSTPKNIRFSRSY
ncbi:hypothetical protein LEP1GSC192_3811 [Leptospira sp. B5-022]|nr:hypothetical protein LEP1GSC192_3811 [Leptospira sp. B5-022]